MRLLLAVPDIDLEAKANLEMATPLMAAIWRGALQSVMELVTTPGIDLEAKDSRGRSLEDWASGRMRSWRCFGMPGVSSISRISCQQYHITLIPLP